ncbi:DUF6363 domain-containing protein [Flavonifractor plautii]|uniref:DUF6363 domain-containing protein n=1 Tax=Flavonifractor plautii TaxID=292800 RepID=UPI003EEB0E57
MPCAAGRTPTTPPGSGWFQLEREGRALLFAPHSTEGFHRTEKDVEKIRALWKDGYDEGMERLDEVQAFLSGS